MKRYDTSYAKDRPTQRPLKIFSSDPMLGRTEGNWVTIDVRNEGLRPGPSGARLQGVDYDGVHDCVYEPVNLDAPAILMKVGLRSDGIGPAFSPANGIRGCRKSPPRLRGVCCEPRREEGGRLISIACLLTRPPGAPSVDVMNRRLLTA